jgi:hypothetical protein
MRAAAHQTRNRAADPVDTGKIATATRTLVKKTPRAFYDGERQIVAALFVANPKIAASLAPFRSMRQNATPSGAKLREKMRQLMAKRAIDFFFSVLSESRIQRNQFLAIIGAAGRAFQAWAPFHAHVHRDLVSADRLQKFARFSFKIDITLS